MKNLKRLGFNAEERVVQYLKNNGFAILKRNYRTRYGEIDIIAQKLDTVYFIEVKLIKNVQYLPEAKINQKKKRALKRTALMFLEETAPNENEKNTEFWLIAVIESPKNTQKPSISIIHNLSL